MSTVARIQQPKTIAQGKGHPLLHYCTLVNTNTHYQTLLHTIILLHTIEHFCKNPTATGYCTREGSEVNHHLSTRCGRSYIYGKRVKKFWRFPNFSKSDQKFLQNKVQFHSSQLSSQRLLTPGTSSTQQCDTSKTITHHCDTSIIKLSKQLPWLSDCGNSFFSLPKCKVGFVR